MAAAGVEVTRHNLGRNRMTLNWGVLKPGGKLVTIAASSERTTDEHACCIFHRRAKQEANCLADRLKYDPPDRRRHLPARQHKPAHGKVLLQIVGAR